MKLTDNQREWSFFYMWGWTAGQAKVGEWGMISIPDLKFKLIRICGYSIRGTDYIIREFIKVFMQKGYLSLIKTAPSWIDYANLFSTQGRKRQEQWHLNIKGEGWVSHIRVFRDTEDNPYDLLAGKDME